MAGLILWLTVLVLPLPLVMLWLGSMAGGAMIIAAFVAAVYLFIWLYMRPTWFNVSADGLEIEWPMRRANFPASDIERVEEFTFRAFREQFGWGMRIGAGGLWGGFGLLKTRSVTFRFYISRLDRFVVIWRNSDRPLMLTPADPTGFVQTLEALTRP